VKAEASVTCHRCRSLLVDARILLSLSCDGPQCVGRTAVLCLDCGRELGSWLKHRPELPHDLERDATPEPIASPGPKANA
jgi:hypothetical protein